MLKRTAETMHKQKVMFLNAVHDFVSASRVDLPLLVAWVIRILLNFQWLCPCGMNFYVLMYQFLVVETYISGK